MSKATLYTLSIVLACAVCQAARFTDTFSTDPGKMDRKPFVWDRFNAYHGAGSVWQAQDGYIQYRAEDRTGTYTALGFPSAGIDVSDETTWSTEVGFQHVSGTAPKDYIYVSYLRWNTPEQGRMRIVGLCYDPEKRELWLYNSVSQEGPFPADLSGDFHPVRMTCEQKTVRIYVDGKLVGGPIALKDRAYGGGEEFFLGPLTKTENHTLDCRWDYLAFTDEGAFVPGVDAWNPAADIEPVAEGLSIVEYPDVFRHPPYPGITVVSKEKGNDRWEQAVPEHMRKYRAVMKATPNSIVVPEYRYPGEDGPSKQNVYQNSWTLKYDDTRSVGNAMLTRGVGDTATGFVDYKMWYRVSTDGGNTYTDLRPIIQQGEQYSPMHPIEYVYVGKNSFCYATIPGIILKMTNGQIIFPCYYAPLDAEGNYYNPLNAYTFSRVCCLIGTWNEAGDDLIWDVSEPVILEPEQASRGAGECAIIELAGKPGHIFMVIRGSNEPNPTGKIPACKWKTLSTDYGKTWSKCEPFTLQDGETFLSPASCSSLIRSSKTGKCYWVGNISRTLPRGNWPRYPLVIGEVDEETLCLRRETVTIIDDRNAEDPPDMQLSNYNLIEDEKTGEFVLSLNRWNPDPKAPGAGTHTYVIRVE